MTDNASHPASALRLAVIPAVFILALGVAISSAEMNGVICSSAGLLIWVIAELSINFVENHHPGRSTFIKSALKVLSSAMALMALSSLFLANAENFSTALPKKMLATGDDIARMAVSSSDSKSQVQSISLGPLRDTKDVIGVLIGNQFSFVDLKQIINPLSSKILDYGRSIAIAVAFMMASVGFVVMLIVWLASSFLWPLLDKMQPHQTQNGSS